jgi:hypothetical protein
VLDDAVVVHAEDVEHVDAHRTAWLADSLAELLLP